MIVSIITFVILTACILAMFIVAANKDQGAQTPWAVILFVSFIQDILVSPVVFTIVQLLFIIALNYAIQKKKIPIVKKIAPKIDENFKTILVLFPFFL